MGNIDWAAVYGRYQQAVHASSEPFGAGQDDIGDAPVLDVRRAGGFRAARQDRPRAPPRDAGADSNEATGVAARSAGGVDAGYAWLQAGLAS